MSDEAFFRLLRWIGRFFFGLVTFGGIFLTYSDISGLSSNSRRPVELAFWFLTLMTFSGMTLLRFTVYRHPVWDDPPMRDKATRKRLARRWWPFYFAVTALQLVSPVAFCLGMGIATGMVAGAAVYPAMLFVRQRPILGWRGRVPGPPVGQGVLDPVRPSRPDQTRDGIVADGAAAPEG